MAEEGRRSGPRRRFSLAMRTSSENPLAYIARVSSRFASARRYAARVSTPTPPVRSLRDAFFNIWDDEFDRKTVLFLPTI